MVYGESVSGCLTAIILIPLLLEQLEQLEQFWFAKRVSFSTSSVQTRLQVVYPGTFQQLHSLEMSQ